MNQKVRIITEDEKNEIRKIYYSHLHRDGNGVNEPRWRGTRVLKFPSDLILYAEVIYDNKPDIIIETGTKFGGSSIFYGDMLKLFNPSGKVITVDIVNNNPPSHSNVEYYIGSSIDPITIEYLKTKIVNKKVMVILDGNHEEDFVKQEIPLYEKLVTSGQFLVVEDVWVDRDKKYGPGKALDWWLTQSESKKFELIDMIDRFMVGVSRGGWLKKN